MITQQQAQAWVNQILATIKTTEANMASTLQDVLNEIANVQTIVNQLGTDLSASIADLQAKIAAGQDTTPAITALQAIATQLTSIDTANKGL